MLKTNHILHTRIQSKGPPKHFIFLDLQFYQIYLGNHRFNRLPNHLLSWEFFSSIVHFSRASSCSGYIKAWFDLVLSTALISFGGYITLTLRPPYINDYIYLKTQNACCTNLKYEYRKLCKEK